MGKFGKVPVRTAPQWGEFWNPLYVLRGVLLL